MYILSKQKNMDCCHVYPLFSTHNFWYHYFQCDNISLLCCIIIFAGDWLWLSSWIKCARTYCCVITISFSLYWKSTCNSADCCYMTAFANLASLKWPMLVLLSVGILIFLYYSVNIAHMFGIAIVVPLLAKACLYSSIHLYHISHSPGWNTYCEGIMQADGTTYSRARNAGYNGIWD